jgi:hypothetical protein
MWILFISLYMIQSNTSLVQSKGVIQAPQPSLEQCYKERDRVKEQWHMDGYRVSPRCVYLKHY